MKLNALLASSTASLILCLASSGTLTTLVSGERRSFGVRTGVHHDGVFEQREMIKNPDVKPIDNTLIAESASKDYTAETEYYGTSQGSYDTVYYESKVSRAVYQGKYCDDYRPSDIKWGAFIKAIYEFLGRTGGKIGPDGLPYKRIAAIFVRAGFHDTGSFVKGVDRRPNQGGADGSIVFSAEEQDWAANGAPFKFVPYLRGALQDLVRKFGVSWPDAIAVAGAVAANFLNPAKDTIRPFNLYAGRCENSKTNPNVLPAADIDFESAVRYWKSIGLDIERGAALLGSHVVMEDGKGHSNGHQQYLWTNKWYTDQWAGNLTVHTDEYTEEKTVEWTGDTNWQYTVSDAMNSPINLTPYHDRKPLSANLSDNLKKWTDEIVEYTVSNVDWIDSYATAYKDLTEVGAIWTKSGKFLIPGV